MTALLPGGLRCPKCGAVSTDPEFCSDCGASMAPGPASPAAPSPPDPAPAAGTPEPCPVCGEPRPGPFARYCDNCRYDFLSRQPFGATPAAVPPPTEPAPIATSPIATPPPATPPAAAAPAPLRWDLHAAVDPSLRRPGDPEPSDTRTRIFPLDLSDHLVGRRSDKEDIHPEIPLADPGISRRHARILRSADGAISLLDLGSTNGTRLNGAPVEPNLPTPLADGDAVTMGCWTRLTVVAR